MKKSNSKEAFLLKNNLLITGLFALCLAGAFMSGFIVHAAFYTSQAEFPILSQAFSILIDHAYYPISDVRALEYGMIRGMLQAYGDPYAIFLEPVQNELESNSLEGKFGGIGIDILKDEEGYFVIYPFPNSPASRSGLREGDRLLKIDDFIVNQESSLDAIQAAIRGPVGEPVIISIARTPDFLPQRISILREEFKLPSVTSRVIPDYPKIGYVKVNVIATNTPEEIHQAFDDLASRGAESYILDLRNNGGGLLNAGVETARLFLEKGEIISQQYAGENIETFQVIQPGPLSDKRLIALINHSTASAAEIIAGALQQHGKAILVGEPSYGKNTIQLVFTLEDNSSIHLTTARWWFPNSSENVGEGGLEPDLNLSAEEISQEQVVDEAIKLILRK